MKANEGSLDRIIRGVVGLVALFFGIFVLSGVLQVIAFVVAAGGIFTALTGFCGLYALLGINTCPVKKD